MLVYLAKNSDSDMPESAYSLLNCHAEPIKALNGDKSSFSPNKDYSLKYWLEVSLKSPIIF